MSRYLEYFFPLVIIFSQIVHLSYSMNRKNVTLNISENQTESPSSIKNDVCNRTGSVERNEFRNSSNFKILNGSSITLHGELYYGGEKLGRGICFFSEKDCRDHLKGYGDEDELPVLLLCDEKVHQELKEIQGILKLQLQNEVTSGSQITGVISMLSAFSLVCALVIYLLLWDEQTVHGWIQFSFLLALFCTYFVAGLRRLIGYETLLRWNMAVLFDALEDFGAVSTSANLVAISYDLLSILWKSTPVFPKREGRKQCLIIIVLSWASGLIVMTAGIIIKSRHKYTTKSEELKTIHNLKTYLPKLLELLLCIQNDLLFSIGVPIFQVLLFTLNLILFVGSVIILYKRKVETKIVYENFEKSYVFKFWVRRFAKLFLLMGVWWPMIVVCIFGCKSMLKYSLKTWTFSLENFNYKDPLQSKFSIPWHMYVVSNLLAFQAIFTSIMFVCNRKSWTGLKKIWRKFVQGNASASFTTTSSAVSTSVLNIENFQVIKY